MSLHIDKMNASTWVTAEGRKVKVKKMESSHLGNTILWLRRHAFVFRMDILRKTGELMFDMTDDQVIMAIVPCYKSMLEAAAERHLFKLGAF